MHLNQNVKKEKKQQPKNNQKTPHNTTNKMLFDENCWMEAI